jgi:hypothetical protein
MKKRKLIILIGALVLGFSIISISTMFSIYASKPIKMIYKLKPGESTMEAAQRFKITEFGVVDEYMMFEVK